MTVFRDVLGRNLSPDELDGNFREANQRLDALEATRPQPDNFASVVCQGTQITFTLISGQQFSFDLPVLKWRFRGEWTPSTGYAALDTFSRAGVGLFLTLLDHTSGATFDAAAVLAGDTVTAGGFITDAAYTILTVGTTDFTLIGADANTVGHVFTATGPGSGTGTATTNLPVYQELIGLGLGRPHYAIGFSAPQVTTYSESQVLGHHAFACAVTIPADFGAHLGRTSRAGGSFVAAADAVFSVEKAEAAAPTTWSQVGTITIASGTVTPTFASAGGLPISFEADDRLRIVAPASPDTTFVGFYATLVGFET